MLVHESPPAPQPGDQTLLLKQFKRTPQRDRSHAELRREFHLFRQFRTGRISPLPDRFAQLPVKLVFFEPDFHVILLDAI